jgi:hypothetical protein
MTRELPPEVERAISELSEDEMDALILRTRSIAESADPKLRAARALSRAVGGRPATKVVSREYAASKLAEYRRNNS